MNKKQYNNIIDYTIQHEVSLEGYDSLSTARAVFDNVGIPLPQGEVKSVYEIIKTNDYMGWKSCTIQEAKAAVEKGIAAIGISETEIVVFSSTDQEQPVTKTASVFAIDENTKDSVSGLTFYQYANVRSSGNQYGASWGSLEDAMNYYGTDFTYTYCGGGYYNYYYTFADGSRMYFHVG